MPEPKTPAPGRREGFGCLRAADDEAFNIIACRAQFLARHNILPHRISLFGPAVFGEAEQ